MRPVSFAFEAIGTHWQIDYAASDTLDEDLVRSRIDARIDEYDITYSRFRADSLVTKISKKAGTYKLPLDSRRLFEVYHTLYRITGGQFTPLIGQVMEDAGYDSTYSLKPKKLTAPPPWEECIQWNNGTLETKRPVLLDFGAGGKGQLIDEVATVMEALDIFEYCIDAGGDIIYKTSKPRPLRIGLESPSDTSEVIGVVPVLNTSICGSAGNRRAWGAYHHIIDPKKLISPKTIAATWVMADETLVADAIATALFFTTAEVLQKEFSFSYCILFDDHRIEHSDDFNAEFYYNKQ